MRKPHLALSLCAPDPASLLSRLEGHYQPPADRVTVNLDRVDVLPSEAEIRQHIRAKFRNLVRLKWTGSHHRSILTEQRYLKFRESAALHPDLRPLRHLFGHDFNDEFVVCDALWKWDGYMTPGFGGGLDGIGWFLALKGELGHRHLASRRILAYGPWRLLRMEDDVTFIEFHDPDAEEATALEQAKPGHAMMWNNFFMPTTKLRDDGDVLEDGRVWSYGVYDSQTRTLTHVVEPGRTLTHMDGIRLSAVRNYPRLDVGPIDQVDCLFMDESDAMEQRFGCWAYGQGCRTFRDGEEVDLLVDYEPPAPEVPDWVRELDAKEGVDTDAVRAELMG